MMKYASLFVICGLGASIAQAQPANEPKHDSVNAALVPHITKESYERALEYSKSHKGHALLVMQDDTILFEDYHNHWTSSRPHLLASGTKSFTGVVALFAEQDGLLKLDELASDTITEWKSDPRKSKITIRQLLSLCSGLDPNGIGVEPDYIDTLHAKTHYDPGEHFEYGPQAFAAFGHIMTIKLKASGRTYGDYLKEKILNPLQIEVGFWRGFANGEPKLASGANLTAREWAKFGAFIAGGGKVGDKQLLPSDKIDELFKATGPNKSYGLSWWLAADADAGIASEDGPRIAMAAGAGKQRLYVIPEASIVIVRFGAQADYSDKDFLELLFGKSKEVAEATLGILDMDQNGDGVITRDEFARAKLSKHIEFAILDANGDGKLTRDEIRAALRRKK